MGTLTRADLTESVYRNIGLSRNESSDLVEAVLGEAEGDAEEEALGREDAVHLLEVLVGLLRGDLGAVEGVEEGLVDDDVEDLVVEDRAQVRRVREVRVVARLCDRVPARLQRLVHPPVDAQRLLLDALVRAPRERAHEKLHAKDPEDEPEQQRHQ